MRLTPLFAIASVLTLVPFAAPSTPPAGLTGFSPAAARVERDWETKFKAIPSPDSQRAYMRHLTARPHHVGSPYDSANAQWILAHFKSWGLDAHIERFEVLFPTPRERLVELVAPTHFRASLAEPTVAGDPTSSQQAEQLPTYNAYSIDGDVTAPLVYVNYGLQEDYDSLERHGVSVKGAIVIARYGNSWRGVKPMVAAEHGAVGCIIYSDPADDGYDQGDVFPKGPYRPREGVQRGSVMEMQLYPGDPLTPGVGATHDAKRLSRADAQTITKIPVLPISYGDAQPLLAALGGPVAPPDWRGGLGVTYHMGGPGPARVHLVVKSNWDVKPVYDVIATIRGAAEPDQWVVRGNHEDAWVNGAEDPTAGQAALMEEARGLGALLAQGWHPQRTIIYAAWDGEEPMLLGSTEWVEEHADELRQKAVAYINSDTNDRGYLFAGGTPSLASFISDVAKDVEDPETHLSVWKRRKLADIRSARSDDQRRQMRASDVLRVGPLGSGSDYSGFVDHIGVASLNIGFGGESQGAGVYHSVYDDFYWYTHFSDTSFVYGRALSQVGGTAVMRLADAQVLPYDFAGLASTVQGYVSDLQKLLQTEQDETTERNREIQEGVFAATSDPWHPTSAPPMEPVPPHLGFAPLQNGADSLTHAADRYAKAFAALAADTSYGAGAPAPVNALLLQAARRLTDKRGLPGRPWYTFELEAPGMYTGYGAKTIPAVREAIEQRKFPLAQEQIQTVGAVLDAEAALVDSAARMLGSRSR